MTYARKKAAAPATAAKPNEAWRPEAAPVNGVPDGVEGEPVAAGLVAFYHEVSNVSLAWVYGSKYTFPGAMEPVPLATGPGAPPAPEAPAAPGALGATAGTVGATVTVL